MPNGAQLAMSKEAAAKKENIGRESQVDNEVAK